SRCGRSRSRAWSLLARAETCASSCRCAVSAPGDPQRPEDAADGGCADPVAELEQLALDPLVSPAVVFGGEPPGERSDLCADGWPASPVRVGPLPGDQAAVPPEYGPGCHQPVGPQPGWQDPDQGGEDRAVGPVQPGPRTGTAQYRDLMPHHQQLNVLGDWRAARQDKPAAEPDQDEIQQTKGHGRSSSPTADVDAGASLQIGGQADFWHPARCFRFRG